MLLFSFSLSAASASADSAPVDASSAASASGAVDVASASSLFWSAVVGEGVGSPVAGERGSSFLFVTPVFATLSLPELSTPLVLVHLGEGQAVHFLPLR